MPRKDTFTNGLIIGTISLFLSYIILNFALNYLAEKLNRPEVFAPPKVQLIILAINILIFRYIMINRKMYHAAQGVFIVIFAAVLVYFFHFQHKL